MLNSASSIRQVAWSNNSNIVDHAYTTVIRLLLGTLSLSLKVISSRTAQRCLLATIILNVPLHISKHFFLHETAAKLGAVGGLDTSLSTAALALLYLSWFLRFRTAAPRRIRNDGTVPVLIFLLCSIASLLVANDVTLGLFQVFSTIQAVLLYIYIRHIVTSREEVRFICRFLLIGLLIEVSWMLAQACGLVSAGGALVQELYAETNRLPGTMGSSNAAASYLAMMIAMTAIVPFAQFRRRYKYLAITGMLMATIALVFTLSRGGWLSFLVSLMIVIALCGRSYGKAGLGVVALVLLLAVPFVSVITNRITSDDNGSAATRGTLNTLTLRMIKDHPLFGVGANNFYLVMDAYAESSGEWLYTVHNTYLLVWSEIGIGGLLAFLCFLTTAVRQGWHCWKARDALFSPVAVGCVAAIVGHMVHMSVDLFREGASVELLWLLAGLISAMYRLTARSPGLHPQVAMLEHV